MSQATGSGTSGRCATPTSSGRGWRAHGTRTSETAGTVHNDLLRLMPRSAGRVLVRAATAASDGARRHRREWISGLGVLATVTWAYGRSVIEGPRARWIRCPGDQQARRGAAFAGPSIYRCRAGTRDGGDAAVRGRAGDQTGQESRSVPGIAVAILLTGHNSTTRAIGFRFPGVPFVFKPGNPGPM